jgi:hypothetical protein
MCESIAWGDSRVMCLLNEQTNSRLLSVRFVARGDGSGSKGKVPLFYVYFLRFANFFVCLFAMREMASEFTRCPKRNLIAGGNWIFWVNVKCLSRDSTKKLQKTESYEQNL